MGKLDNNYMTSLKNRFDEKKGEYSANRKIGLDELIQILSEITDNNEFKEVVDIKSVEIYKNDIKNLSGTDTLFESLLELYGKMIHEDFITKKNEKMWRNQNK